MRPIPLSNKTLHQQAPSVAVPRYSRASLTQGIVHLSVGYFHRSHQAVYLDDLANRGHTQWGLTGVGLRRRAMGEALVPQDGLYTVVERDAMGDRPRIIGVMGRYLFAPEDPRGVIDALIDEGTRLVTLTVTGAGYRFDPADATFDADDEEVTKDSEGDTTPYSALALLVEALDLRRRMRRAPFTVLSCDNIPRNGAVTRRAVVAYARLFDPELSRWIDSNVSFPSSMVDRITPQTTDADRERLAREFGVVDRWPVMTEPFSGWVVEDDFCNERPPLDEVGVHFVRDVEPFSLTKTRLLNASHLLLGTLGRVAGFATMADVMRDPAFRPFAESVMRDEISPSLPDCGIDLAAYRRSLLERMSNPKMRDQVARLCRGASLKFPRHVLPSVLAAREEGRDHALLTIGVAGVCRQLSGIDDRRRRFDHDDPGGARLRSLALAGGTDPRPLLSERSVFGNLGEDPDFVGELEDTLEAFERDGVRATVARAVSSEGLVAA